MKFYLLLSRPTIFRQDLGQVPSTDPHALDRLWDYPSVSLFAVHEMIRLMARVQPLLARISSPTLIIYSMLTD